MINEAKPAASTLHSLRDRHLQTYALFDQSGLDLFECADVSHDVMVAARLVSSLKKNDAHILVCLNNGEELRYMLDLNSRSCVHLGTWRAVKQIKVFLHNHLLLTLPTRSDDLDIHFSKTTAAIMPLGNSRPNNRVCAHHLFTTLKSEITLALSLVHLQDA